MAKIEKPLFEQPIGLELIRHFSISRVQTWGRPKLDQAFKEDVRQAAGVLPSSDPYEWFVFAIRGIVDPARGRFRRQVPDVENIPKLIVDAFTGTLYPDDNLHYVRGIQVEAIFGQQPENCTEVWIYGKRKEGSQA